MKQIWGEGWKRGWLLQILIALLIGLCGSFLPLFFPLAALALRVVFLWALSPAFGAWSACLLAQRGMTCYASWIAPPLLHAAVPWLCIGYPPAGLSMALCAFVSLVGAATGDVLYRRRQR